jgi:hypothetical protein
MKKCLSALLCHTVVGGPFAVGLIVALMSVGQSDPAGAIR